VRRTPAGTADQLKDKEAAKVIKQLIWYGPQRAIPTPPSRNTTKRISHKFGVTRNDRPFADKRCSTLGDPPS
jgi:hypothetical protein